MLRHSLHRLRGAVTSHLTRATKGGQKLGATFWTITTSKEDTHECTHGIANASVKDYASYHLGTLALFRALEDPKETSYPWEGGRPDDICPVHIGEDGKPLASSARRRNTQKKATPPMPPDPATSGLARNASRASGLQTKEDEQGGRRLIRSSGSVFP